MLFGGRGEYTDTILVYGSSKELLTPLLDNLTVDCYSQYLMSEIVLNAELCQCRNGMESDRVFVCTEPTCECTSTFVS